MLDKGICKIKILLNGKCFVSICGDKSVYDPNSDDILINADCFRNLFMQYMHKNSYEEVEENVYPSLRGKGKPFTVRKAALARMARDMKEWDVGVVIKGDPKKLDEYRRIIKTAWTSIQNYQIVFL